MCEIFRFDKVSIATAKREIRTDQKRRRHTNDLLQLATPIAFAEALDQEATRRARPDADRLARVHVVRGGRERRGALRAIQRRRARVCKQVRRMRMRQARLWSVKTFRVSFM